MSKKNIGAVVSVIAASAAVASAYASTVTNLESDKHTNSLISEENKEVQTSNSFLKSEYTKEVKNTKIAGQNNDRAKANQEIKQDVLIEKTAKKIAEPIIVEAKENEEVKEEQTPKVEDTKSDKIVAYDDTDLDEAIRNEIKEDKKELTYAKSEESSSNEVVENKEEVVVSDKFVNTAYLNIRSSKDDSNNNNIVRTIKAGDKLVGYVDGDWFVSNEGYTNINYLSNSYPQALVDQVNAEEAKKAKAARRAQLIEQLKAKKARLAELEAQEAKAAQEEAAKKAQEAKAAEEAKKAQQAQAQKSVYSSGWISTEGLNVRDRAVDGNIINSLSKGTWVEGSLANGWLEVNLNGQKGYINASYLSATEISKDVVKEAVRSAEAVIEESAKQPVQANNNAQGAASVASQFTGLPYVWGSSDPNVGFDCSGLTSYAYRQIGVSLPHSSQAQFNNGYAVDMNNLQAGDLVFFSFNGGSIDHVGIMTSSDGTFIHASTPTTGVRYDNIFNGSFQRNYRGARRIF
uniref:SH3 domain-containing C40 family peptidase n=1 Tax=Anaerococcus mediterraneensis TaxID=1870984 RepID=UPI0009315DEF|nr:SH3 domain-containing C40 family peptidase [Anaerococcus mediterraneensis]